MTWKQKLRHWLANEMQTLILAGWSGYLQVLWKRLKGQKAGLVLGALMVLMLFLIPRCAMAAAEVTPGPWTLYRGTSIVQPRVDYPTLEACAAAADRLTPRTYTCRTIAQVVVTATPPPPPVPVNCAVSQWGAWQPGAWGACSNGTQSRTETRTRTITTQPANGGTACPALTETRTVSQACTVAPPPPPPPPPATASITGTASASTASVTLAGDFRRFPGAATGSISALTATGSQTGTAVENWIRRVNGTGDHIYAYGSTAALTFTVQADATERVLTVYVGGHESAGRLTASIGSTTYTHTSAAAADDYALVYRITYKAAAATTMTVRWALASGTGAVSIQGAAITGPAPPPPPPATGTASLSWQPVTMDTNGQPVQIGAYRVYHGVGTEALQRVAEVDSTTFAASQLPAGVNRFAVTAVSTAGVEGGQSSVGSKTIQ